MANWTTKKDAIDRMKSNKLLQEVLQIEPTDFCNKKVTKYAIIEA